MTVICFGQIAHIEHKYFIKIIRQNASTKKICAPKIKK